MFLESVRLGGAIFSEFGEIDHFGNFESSRETRSVSLEEVSLPAAMAGDAAEGEKVVAWEVVVVQVLQRHQYSSFAPFLVSYLCNCQPG